MSVPGTQPTVRPAASDVPTLSLEEFNAMLAGDHRKTLAEWLDHVEAIANTETLPWSSPNLDQYGAIH